MYNAVVDEYRFALKRAGGQSLVTSKFALVLSSREKALGPTAILNRQ